MKRTCSRIIAMQVIYNYNLNNELNFTGIVDIANQEEVEYDYDYLVELTNGVINNQKELDFMISMNLKNYTLDRLSVVDRSLLELGVY